ncbi:helicase-exonuclease AddAB subunit AddA [Paenibacillus endoradicis]|uniref:helicase-exonuclease AddAB subunit AddA n=1 Tax=Paenibacillus endoradicis TaxID=2972487 RepID=UPI002159A5DC|nr:helicase-exonuclease AddAB subunit AddA [Paenibacillus endoradicis]MCR8659213.1 helicase-exonuclease AddAB subunit AddA [Paenibacillus endoradicis]
MSGQSSANAPRWTDEQYEAIVSDGSNILVAAAAGSGKTAVLVERIIRKVASNTDVDRLLVATFTHAAAAEMKDRLKIALEKKLEEEPDSDHLRKQLALMGKSSITTLHSFCMEVIRKYYSLIDLDPGFRIANETEIELIRADVMNELFEQRYSGVDEPGGGDFLKLVNSYGGEKGDDPLFQLVERLYLFSRSHPWPAQWLNDTLKPYLISSIDELERSKWVQQIIDDVHLKLEGAISAFEQALSLTKLPAGPFAYASTFEADITVITTLQHQLLQSPWREWPDIFANVQFDKLAPLRGKDHDKDLQDRAKNYREQGKDTIQSIANDYFGRSAEQFLEELHELAPLMKALIALIHDFSSAFDATKRAKGLLDFGDLEHYSLAILLDKDSNAEQLIPSEAAKDYQQQFDEILLDEYQDTNMVQETIVRLIANQNIGNRFMVGDVKQSIYRFRLAEPKLFLEKYKKYSSESASTIEGGKRIDLARNFRSRSQVVDAVNEVFRAIMKEKVAEMEYDGRAELVHGATYYEAPISLDQCKVQLTIIDRGERVAEEQSSEQEEQVEPSADDQLEELNVAQLEARYIAQQLLKLSEDNSMVFDSKLDTYRPMKWRDTVILLRATSAWAPIFLEELQLAGIPAYSSIGSGYFDAVEVQTMLSCLQVIDNPYQDIPLAATLRSPLFSLTAEQLSGIRILSMDSNFYDAIIHAAGSEDYELDGRQKLSFFLHKLDQWRNLAREGSLSDLLWLIYEETGYYDFVGGLPAGIQRQANLRALHDRARQYEATSFRGLFRFLKFIERMRANGNDLGTALAIGEQEDVVKIMTTHASKGLEFPIVFVAGLGKKFNEQDLNASFLYHKELGFGPKYVDATMRISYPSLPYYAIRRSMKMELLAEEMRILYVALTRPKEKLYLLGTSGRLLKQLPKWNSSLELDGTLQQSSIAAASCYLDWIAPLVATQLQLSMEEPDKGHVISPHDWIISVVAAESLSVIDENQVEVTAEDELVKIERMTALQALALLEDVAEDQQLRNNLERNYPFMGATTIGSKASITEMKRIQAAFEEETETFYQGGSNEAGTDTDVMDTVVTKEYTLHLERPSFMEEKKITATEKGSINHLMMQHIPLTLNIDEQTIEQSIERMKQLQIITLAQAEVINIKAIVELFRSELGYRMQHATWLKRELPFSFMLPAHEVHRNIDEVTGSEKVFIQGIIDCIFEDERGLVLVDYKTDRIFNGNWAQKAEEHRFQLEMYARGLEMILHRKVDEIYVFFFDGGRAIQL